MAFASVQQKTLLTDVIKTWIKHFKDTWNFPDITFRTSTPDTDKDLTLPIIVLKRVSNDTWSNNRNWGFYRANGETATTVNTLYWYTYTSMIQFDIMTTTTTQCNELQGLLYDSLKGSSFGSRTHIPLRTFIWTSTQWAATDLNMKFYFNKDLDWAILPSFDPNLHLASISVEFAIDYLSEVSNPKILDTSIVYNIN